MTWIIIGLILLAAFGPVLWLVPSKRDRHLSALRDQARREGLVVELRRLPKINPSADERVTAGGRVKDPRVECTAYMHMLSRRLVNLPGWRLLQGESDHQVREGWALDHEVEPHLKQTDDAFTASLNSLESLFEAIPGDVIGVELGARSLILYWLEGSAADRTTVTAMSAMLRAAEELLLATDDRFQPIQDDEDS